MSNFRVGQRVVCVRDDFNPDPTCKGAMPKKGEVFVVTDVDPTYIELDRYPRWWFLAHFFRPVDDLQDQVDRIEKEGLPAELLEELADAMEPQYALN